LCFWCNTLLFLLRELKHKGMSSIKIKKLTQIHVTFPLSFQRKDQELPIHDVIGIDCCNWNVGLELYAPFFKIGPTTTHIPTLRTRLYSRGHPSYTDFTLWCLPKACLPSNFGLKDNDQKFKTKQYFFPMAQLPLVGQGLIIIDASLPHSVIHTTLGRTPLEGWSPRRRELYLTTHNTHKRQTSVAWRHPNPRLGPRGPWDRKD